ncbi:PI31 proteasome regulator N-terminal-domain-containing protein [Xylaria palmicola]|nr:PI31 proteasome regulator N-terminal-domain-containing protein [Xylaria palmicola]
MLAEALHPDSVCRGMANALPTHEPNDPTSDLSSSHEVIALLAHACMAATGFRAIGFDDENIKEAEFRAVAPRLPSNWNASFNTYGFVYAHPQSTHHYLLKVDRFGPKANIRALDVSDQGNIAHLEVIMRDYVLNTELPMRIPLFDDGREDRSTLHNKMLNVFTSQPGLFEFTEKFKQNIIKMLLSAPQIGDDEDDENDEDDEDDGKMEDKNGEEAKHHHVQNAPQRTHQQPPSEVSRLLPQPAQAHWESFPQQPQGPVPPGDFPPPGFEDTYDINRSSVHRTPVRTPFGNIGADDLNPPGLGPHDPLRPGLQTSSPRLPGFGGARGMYPTLDEPPFGGYGGNGYPGAGFDPQVPPGARYDPLGPGGMPRFSGRHPESGNDMFGDQAGPDVGGSAPGQNLDGFGGLSGPFGGQGGSRGGHNPFGGGGII